MTIVRQKEGISVLKPMWDCVSYFSPRHLEVPKANLEVLVDSRLLEATDRSKVFGIVAWWLHTASTTLLNGK